ncbi:MAG: twin-arginine translocase TatA/TatE family subunit [Chloroflexota bacterium]|nr:twin-arginine translocase TatA/TatE family subunit [Chloroflexota bacterium]
MGVLQPWHLIIVLVIVLLIFGPGKLPLLGKAIGDSFRDFKKSVGSDDSTATDVELAPGMRACPHCRKPVAIADRFCASCGGRVEPHAA